MLYIAIIITAFLTSVLSGLVGMAGGAVLMAVLITILPVSSAMILHGATQAMANGSRTLLLREHLIWRLLPGYGLRSCLRRRHRHMAGTRAGPRRSADSHRRFSLGGTVE